MKFHVSNIEWDTSGVESPDNPSLPDWFLIECEDEESLSDAISDEYGFCHFGFDYMPSFVVLYFTADYPAGVPEPFQCYADDVDHAEEQAKDAYPDMAGIAWVVDTDDPEVAYADYYKSMED